MQQVIAIRSIPDAEKWSDDSRDVELVFTHVFAPGSSSGNVERMTRDQLRELKQKIEDFLAAEETDSTA